MSNQNDLTMAQKELALALSGLQPGGSGIDRDQMFFQAGLATGHRRQRIWQGATAALSLVIAVLLILPVFSNTPQPVVNTPNLIIVDQTLTLPPNVKVNPEQLIQLADIRQPVPVCLILSRAVLNEDEDEIRKLEPETPERIRWTRTSADWPTMLN